MNGRCQTRAGAPWLLGAALCMGIAGGCMGPGQPRIDADDESSQPALPAAASGSQVIATSATSMTRGSAVITSNEPVVYAEGFEGDLAGWTLEGLWHVTERRAAEGTHAAWYGREETGNYDTGTANAGELTSPVISLAGVQNPILVFSEFLDVQAQAGDSADVIVFRADDPGQVAVFPKTTGSTLGTYAQRILAIPELAGADIRITFRFDTVDDIANQTEGWYVDDIRIIDAGGPACAHALCDPGAGLDPTCDPCAQTVCAQDPFCCETEWDSECVFEAQDSCGLTCGVCGDAQCGLLEDCTSCPQDCGVCPACEHDLCQTGVSLAVQCDACAGTVCADDPFCCEVLWDRICVQEVESLCGVACDTCGNGLCDPDEACASCPQDCGPCPVCEHDLCEAGGPLAAQCDPCSDAVCAQDPFCCEVMWDVICVEAAETACGLACPPCVHEQCNMGEALDASCDVCTAMTCDFDPYCCEQAWDSRCVTEASQICGLACETCSHDPCSFGSALSAACDPCVTAVCDADPFCCIAAWDERCVAEAAVTCGFVCELAR